MLTENEKSKSIITHQSKTQRTQRLSFWTAIDSYYTLDFT
jgi:hypothetical protein